MADDMDRVRRNVRRMIEGGARAPEIDQYLSGEGVTPDALRGTDASRLAGAQGPVGAGKLGLWDTINAGVRATARGVPILGGLADRADPQPELDATFAQQHPIASTALPMAGGVASMLPLAATGLGARALGVTGPNIAARMGAGALSGAALGAGDAAVRGGDPVKGGVVGGVLGGAMPGVGHAVGALVGRPAMRAQRAALPTSETMKSAGHSAYQAAEQAGLVFTPRATNNLVTDLEQTARDIGYSPHTLNQTFSGAFREADEMFGREVSLRDIDRLRQAFARAGKDINNRDNGRIAGAMVDRIDAFLTGLKPQDVVAGDLRAGIAAIGQARQIWGRARRIETLEGIQESARNTKGGDTSAGYQRALQDEFRKLTRNQREFRRFTPEERTAILRVVRGDPVGAVLRGLSKFAPDSPLVTAIGFTVLTPAIGMPAYVGGEFAKRIATGRLNRRTLAVDDLVRGGRSLVPPPAAIATRQGVTAGLQSLALPNVRHFSTGSRF